MKVYELIQELSQYKADTEVEFHVKETFDTDVEAEFDRDNENDTQEVTVTAEFDEDVDFDDLSFDNEQQIWCNKKYKIEYLHDGNLTKEEFISRYKRRIENFKNIISSKPEVMFVLTDFNKNYSVEDINAIYDNLLKRRNNKPFKFVLISFVDDNSPQFSISDLNKNILHKEYKTDVPVLEFKKGWPNKYDDFHPLISEPIREVYEYMRTNV